MKKGESEKKDLMVQIAFWEGLRKRMPKDVEVLKLLGDAYTHVGQWAEGLEVDQKLVSLLPKDPWVHYNLACSLSLMNDLKESANALLQAIHHGYDEWDWLKKDPDLKNLRASSEFESIVNLLPKG